MWLSRPRPSSQTRPAVGLLSWGVLAAAACGPHPLPGAPPLTTANPSAVPVVQAVAPEKNDAAAAYQGHGVESVSAEALAAFAPPSLPAEVRRNVQAMLDVRAPAAGALSDDGRRMFFNWNVTGSTQIWRLDGPLQFPTQMTGGEDTTKVVAVLPDGKHIVVSRDRKGEENPGLYLQDVSGGPLQVIAQKDKVQTFLDRVADDGRSLYYRANDRKPDSYAIYRWDLASKKAELVFSEDGIWSVADHRGTDGHLLLEKVTGNTSNEFFEYDPGSKRLTPIVGQGEKEDHEVAFAKELGEFFVRTNKLGEYHRLYRLKGKELQPVTPDIPHDVNAFDLDRSRTRILYQVNEGGYTRAHAIDSKTKKEIVLPKLPSGDHVIFGATSHNGRFTTVTVDTSRAPPKSYAIDWTSRRAVTWHEPSSPELDPASFAVASLDHYVARDGAKIPMFVRRPASCRRAPCPVVVHFHGGPEAQTKPGFNTRAQLFVEAGFVFLEPNVRGSDGYGKTWLHADDGPKRLAVITDIEDCAKAVREKFAASGKAPKVGIYGGSYGGYSTLVGMTMFAGSYDAGASIVGISSLSTFLQNTAPYRRSLRVSEYGDPDKDRDALRKLSPVTYLDRVRAPLLLVQGATDPRVPVGEAIQIHKALESKKIDSKLIIFPDEGHGTQKRENRVLEMGHVLRFFEQHLN